MSDLERRLRAALGAASEQAPDDLMAAIIRRHRRHRRRAGACLLAVAAVAGLASPLVSNALRGISPGGPPAAATGVTPAAQGRAPASSPGRAAPSSLASPAARPHRAPAVAGHAPVAAPGTVLSGCAGANPGHLGSGWQVSPGIKAGPLWFLDGGHSRGQLRLYVAVAVLDHVPQGTVIVVRVAPAGRGYLRFLYGPDGALSPGTTYTMRSGTAGVTFVACRPDQGQAAGITDYVGGFLVKGARCVPVQVFVPGRAEPIPSRLGACPGR